MFPSLVDGLPSTEPSGKSAAAAKSLQSDSVQPHRWQSTRLPCPWDSPGKKTGVGCHFLLQCMKVKSESEVAQSYLTLSDPMDCSLPGSSIHEIFQARVLEWGAIAFSAGKSGPECIDCGFTRYICLSTLQMYMLLQYLDSNLTYFLDFVWDYLYYIIK